MKRLLFVTALMCANFAFAGENNCTLKDVGNQMNNGHVTWTTGHVRERSVQAASLGECLDAAKESLGDEYDAKITSRRRHSRRTYTAHFKVTKVRYEYAEGSFKSKGNIKIRYKDWDTL